jgi:hypothetical protein
MGELGWMARSCPHDCRWAAPPLIASRRSQSGRTDRVSAAAILRTAKTSDANQGGWTNKERKEWKRVCAICCACSISRVRSLCALADLSRLFCLFCRPLRQPLLAPPSSWCPLCATRAKRH